MFDHHENEEETWKNAEISAKYHSDAISSQANRKRERSSTNSSDEESRQSFTAKKRRYTPPGDKNN